MARRAGAAGRTGNTSMAQRPFQRRAGFGLGAPRLATFVASLALVLAAGLSLRFHLPAGQGFVASHRLALALAGYALLALGVLLPML